MCVTRGSLPLTLITMPAEFADTLASTLGLHPARPMRDGWIVVESAYEYNDEYNYVQDGSTVNSPVYPTRDEAQADANQQQADWENGQDADNWDDQEIPQLFLVQKVRVIE